LALGVFPTLDARHRKAAPATITGYHLFECANIRTILTIGGRPVAAASDLRFTQY
jgi:hypothetical protein